MLVLFLGLSIGNAPADIENWTGTTSSDWDTGTNWFDANNGQTRVPLNYDAVHFYQQTANDNVTFALGSGANPLYTLFFEKSGAGYTVGAVGDTTDGLLFQNYAGIHVEADLAGNGGVDTVNAPIQEGNGTLFLSNWSPATAEPTLTNENVAGYDNTLVINGEISPVAGASSSATTTTALSVFGMGNIDINGNMTLSANSNMSYTQDTVAGTVTESGTNTYNQNTVVGGNLTLDYTTNNTEKLGTSGVLALGNIGNSYSNGTANGGHLVIEGNATSATTETITTLHNRGSSSILVEGSTASGAPMTSFNFGSLSNDYAGSSIDFSTTGNAIITTTNGNYQSPFGGTQNIIGQWATYDESYWAQAGTAQGNAVTGGVVTTITGLVNDDGDSFSDGAGNYTVLNGASGTQTLTAGSEFANTIRFGTTGPGSTTLDMGGGNIFMFGGGVLVAQDVSGNTAITDGSIETDSNQGGFDIINYGTGTLNISAKITEDHNSATSGFDIVGKDGSGTVELSGDNSNLFNGADFQINSGKLIMGSATALGSGNNLALGDATATLDLNGHNLVLGSLNSNGDYVPGNVAAAAGLNSNIVNSAAGTISTLTLEGNGNSNDGNVGTTYNYGDSNLGKYTGGLNEVSGSIISLNVQQGLDTTQVEWLLGTSNPIGDQTGGDGINVAGIEGASTQITGAIVVGKGANLGLIGYGFVETLGALELNGNFGADGNQVTSFGTTYLTGTGAFVPGYQGWGFDLNTVGSVADTFAGNFGTASNISNMYLVTAGTGTVAFANTLYNQGITSMGTSHVIAPAVANGAIITAEDKSSVTLTANSGEIGGQIDLGMGGTVYIAPSSGGGNVVLTDPGNQISSPGGPGNGSIVLNAGSNQSVTVDMGNTGSFYMWNYNYQGSFTLGAAQGIASLGTTDRLVLLTNNGTNNGIMGENGQPLGSNPLPKILGTSFYAQDDSAGSPENATFLTYSGTGLSSDAGLVGYTFTANETNNLSNAGDVNNGGDGVQLITAGTAYSLTSNIDLFGLQIDKGGSLDLSTASVLMGEVNYDGTAGIILNGGSITGNNLNLYRGTSIYTDLDNGTIANINANGQDIYKNGPGTLYIQNISSMGYTGVNEGVLDINSNVGVSGGVFYLDGGVLQGNGVINRQLTNQNDGVVWNSGGFAARGGSLSITLTDSTGSSNLIWGAAGSPYFLGQGNVMQFGSTTADNVVSLESNLDLGVPDNQNQGTVGEASPGQAIYSRVIDVTANSTDTGNPLNYADYAELDGVISSSNAYEGLAKDGNGVLYLYGANTYTGATTIANGTVAIYSDSNLGTAPTAAYALNTTPGINGGALTPGAVEINGGAALAAWGGADEVLSSNRQILLASGTTGATAAIIDVQGVIAGTLANPGATPATELDFGGMIADYVGEVGSLEKQGGGTFNYSGTSLNTGYDAVTAGVFEVSGTGSVNSASNVVVNNSSTGAGATFNYASSVGLTQTVSYGAGGGTFAYNSAVAYGGGNINAAASDIVSGAGNLSASHITIGAGGTILPGNVNFATGQANPGALTTGTVTLVAGGNYNFLLADAAGAAGIGYGTVLASSVDLTGLNSGLAFSINLETLAGSTPGAPANFDGSQDYSFTLFTTGAGGITGLTAAELASDFSIFTVANNGATGFDPADGTWSVVESADDSTLSLDYTAAAAPEPSTWAMLGGGLLLLAFVRRLRSRLV